MSSVPTLFHSELGSALEADVPSVRLGPDEADHARALRLREGDPVRLTDGRGRLWAGTFARPEDGAAAVRLEEPVSGPPSLAAELAFGIAGKDRTLWLVEKAVEMGAAALQPVECERSQSVADAGRSEAFWDRARRRMVAALKQCGGSRLPEIRPVKTMEEYIQARESWPGPAVVLRRGTPTTLRSRLSGWTGRNPACILLGPEGGLTPGEATAAESAGWLPAALGPRVLRFETAAVAALAVAAQERAGSLRGEVRTAAEEVGRDSSSGSPGPERPRNGGE